MAELELDCALPNDYCEFLGIHNGQNDSEPMVCTCSLLPVEQLAHHKKRILALFDNPNESRLSNVDDAIKPIVWSEHWIPIGVSARGRDV
jgi:cell wall assembly regulator SMI1